jgi:hypothetical protein
MLNLLIVVVIEIKNKAEIIDVAQRQIKSDTQKCNKKFPNFSLLFIKLGRFFSHSQKFFLMIDLIFSILISVKKNGEQTVFLILKLIFSLSGLKLKQHF